MRRVLAAHLALALYVACNQTDAPLGNFSTSGRDASTTSGSSGEPTRDAGEDAAAEDDATASSSSSSSSSGALDEDAEAPDAAVEPGLCRVEYTYGVDLPVPGLAGVTAAVAFSVTPDERVLAWLEGDHQVRVASRANESDDFAAPQVITVQTATYPSEKGLSLSADALHLVLTNEGGTQLGELARASTAAPFGDIVDAAPYAAVEPDATLEVPLRWPVLGNRDLQLAISRARPSAPSSPVLVADRAAATDPWPLPSPRTEAVLADGAGNTEPKRVTGISYDGLTLFVRNESSGAVTAVNRPNDGATFEAIYQRPIADSAAAVLPNAACDRLYVLAGGKLTLRRKVEE